MVSFSVNLDGFSLRLSVEAAPRVPRARNDRIEVGSGIEVVFTIVPLKVQVTVVIYSVFGSLLLENQRTRTESSGNNVKKFFWSQLNFMLSDRSLGVPSFVTFPKIATGLVRSFPFGFT